MDMAFPETEKLIRLSGLLACSIDFLLRNDFPRQSSKTETDISDCFNFIRQCSYFFLATATENVPKLRPMGFIHSDGKFLYFATDKRKQVYSDLAQNPRIEIASYNLNNRHWIRISGKAFPESSAAIRQEMCEAYPLIQQEFITQEQSQLVIFRVEVDKIQID